MKEIREKILAMKDPEYKEFVAKIVPNISKDTIVGVRTPELRKYCREIKKDPMIFDFFKELPHEYYEENNLHGFLLETLRDYDTIIREYDRFLPYVDNWATCDTSTPKIKPADKERFLDEVHRWIKSSDVYAVRFAIEMLMNLYLDGDFREEFLEDVKNVQSEEYYINMMRAWYFATALAKQYEPTVKLIENYQLDSWTHNKTIQKAVESNRISPEQKEYLKTFRVKK